MKSAMMVLAFCAGSTLADLCAAGSELSGGNWYCQPVKAIKYSNVGHSGSYNKVTAFNSDGSCSFEPVSYSGSLSPLDEEVSLHFRGPMRLKQVAAYTKTGSASKKRDANSGPHSRRHGHDAFHRRHKEQANEKRADMVTATIDGKVVSWENNWFGEPTGAPAAAAAVVTDVPVADDSPVDTAIVKNVLANSKASNVIDPNAAYSRIGYYNAETQTLDGFTFLGNHGSPGVSGTFDTTFGASLAYLNSEGNGVAASSSILADKLIPSNNEFAIFTDKECSGNDCGVVRPGTVAYHGFEGTDKIFLFEFSMPHEGETGFNGDMPAIWMLNAQVPRTIQYGDCSCWTSGCGEFDIAEILTPGEKRCKSTLHTNNDGGSSDYIERPTSGTMKLAVIFNSADETLSIEVLSDDTEFSGSLTADQVTNFITTALMPWTRSDMSLFLTQASSTAARI